MNPVLGGVNWKSALGSVRTRPPCTPPAGGRGRRLALLIPGAGVRYHSAVMVLSHGHFAATRPRVPALWVALIVLLLAVPALDLGWNEPTLDETQGARCQLHANPVMGCQPASPVVTLIADPLVPLEPPDRPPLLGRPIFIPPRA